jgi:hypothetical protein
MRRNWLSFICMIALVGIWVCYTSCGELRFSNPANSNLVIAGNPKVSLSSELLDSMCGLVAGCNSTVTLTDCRTGILATGGFETPLGLTSGAYPTYSAIVAAEEAGSITGSAMDARSCKTGIEILSCTDARVKAAYDPSASNPFSGTPQLLSTAACGGTFAAAPDIWFSSLEFPDMRNVNIYGAVPMAAGEIPGQPPGIFTGFVGQSSGGVINIINDPNQCHSGNWCLRGDLTPTGSQVAMFSSGYSAGSGPLGSWTQHQFFSAWYKWPAGFSLPPNCGGQLMYLVSSGGRGIIQPNFKFDLGAGWISVYLTNTNPPSNSPTVGALPLDGRWHVIEVELDPAGQKARMWLDGVLAVDWDTPLCGGAPCAIDDTKFGMYFAPATGGCHPAQSESFWVDDMAQGSHRIGL